jgi:hypothetical protein
MQNTMESRVRKARRGGRASILATLRFSANASAALPGAPSGIGVAFVLCTTIGRVVYKIGATVSASDSARSSPVQRERTALFRML